MKKNNRAYRQYFEKALAVLFLLIFVTSCTTEFMGFELVEGSQAELVDFESETDSEEDVEKENEKEDKLLDRADSFTGIAEAELKQSGLQFPFPNQELEDVASPPPDFTSERRSSL